MSPSCLACTSLSGLESSLPSGCQCFGGRQKNSKENDTAYVLVQKDRAGQKFYKGWLEAVDSKGRARVRYPANSKNIKTKEDDRTFDWFKWPFSGNHGDSKEPGTDDINQGRVKPTQGATMIFPVSEKVSLFFFFILARFAKNRRESLYMYLRVNVLREEARQRQPSIPHIKARLRLPLAN